MKREHKTPREWSREITTRTMVCVLCGNKVPPLSKVLTAHFRGTIILCRECEKQIPHNRLDINEDPIIRNLPYTPQIDLL